MWHPYLVLFAQIPKSTPFDLYRVFWTARIDLLFLLEIFPEEIPWASFFLNISLDHIFSPLRSNRVDFGEWCEAGQLIMGRLNRFKFSLKPFDFPNKWLVRFSLSNQTWPSLWRTTYHDRYFLPWRKAPARFDLSRDSIDVGDLPYQTWSTISWYIDLDYSHAWIL